VVKGRDRGGGEKMSSVITGIVVLAVVGFVVWWSYGEDDQE
jgi:hypothetical protein